MPAFPFPTEHGVLWLTFVLLIYPSSDCFAPVRGVHFVLSILDMYSIYWFTVSELTDADWLDTDAAVAVQRALTGLLSAALEPCFIWVIRKIPSWTWNVLQRRSNWLAD